MSNLSVRPTVRTQPYSSDTGSIGGNTQTQSTTDAQMMDVMENFCKQLYQMNKAKTDEVFKDLTTPKDDEEEG